jgi:hypothetical protein
MSVDNRGNIRPYNKDKSPCFYDTPLSLTFMNECDTKKMHKINNHAEVLVTFF